MKLSRNKSIFHIYIIFFILLIGTLAAGFGMIIYNITIQKPNGQVSISKWPIDFTSDFSKYIITTENEPQIMQSGLVLLHENRLWIQIVDTNGDEIFNFEKPKIIATHYSPSEMLSVFKSGIDNYSVFLGSIQSEDKEWTYMIGFPIQIYKIITYVNGNRYASLKPIVYVMFGALLFLLIISTFIYNLIITKQLRQIRKSIREVTSRTYLPVPNNGFFGDVYEELKDLNLELKTNDEVREKDEKLREEWIANITHDLKTPLSPIKGYAELISTKAAETETEDIGKYGAIILKNTAYAEELINDLKLTYQLKNEMLPIHNEVQNIVRFIKEIVIDFLNNPEYEQRNIFFYSESENIEFSFDSILLKRAINNIITNALIHNNKDTVVQVSIRKQSGIKIIIQDNGKGMTKEEIDNLFIRYYRGENTTVKPEGSGLGMAIAKQIVELYGGSIRAESELESGTCITIFLNN